MRENEVAKIIVDVAYQILRNTNGITRLVNHLEE